MEIRTKGIIMILLGIAGIILVCTYDLLAGRGRVSIVGPRSTFVLTISITLIIGGISLVAKKI